MTHATKLVYMCQKEIYNQSDKRSRCEMDVSTSLKIFKIFLFISILSNQLEGAERKFRRGLLNNLHYLEPPERPHIGLTEDEWFEQRLDHFNAQNTRTWKQRYFSSFAFYKEGGPVFIQIGGEGRASPSFLYTGAWLEWANKHNAALFILEHRFYGNSHPTSDLSTENLQWLSSRQGQNDLANFIETMTEKHNFTGPWIAFGGSYPGSMAAWIRLKFPHLISGSVSSSGPLEAKVDFFEYFQVVYDALERDGPQCNIKMKEAIASLEDIIDNPNQWKELDEPFKLCSTFDGTKQEDVANFIGTLVGIAAGAVQYDFNAKGHGLMDVTEVCKTMTDDRNGKSALERLAKLNALSLKQEGAPCLNYTYQSMLDDLLKIEFDGSEQPGGRQWIYQTCSEFGWYQTSDQPKHPYGSRFPLKDSIKLCTDLFGDSFQAKYIEEMIEDSNSYYGAKDLDVDNVVFVHGSIDPWHAMGRTTDLNEDAPAIMIEGTSHCADMYANKKTDPPQLIEARARIGQLVDKWIHDANYEEYKHIYAKISIDHIG